MDGRVKPGHDDLTSPGMLVFVLPDNDTRLIVMRFALNSM
jgi:hypothetical protein